MLLALYSGCATEGTKILLPAQTNFGKYSTVGIKVYYVDSPKEMDKIKKLVASRLIVENSFMKVYDFDKARTASQMLIYVTIKGFYHTDQNVNSAIPIGGGLAIGSGYSYSPYRQRNGFLVMNVKFYQVKDMVRIGEMEITVDNTQYGAYGQEYGTNNIFDNYGDYLLNCGVNELMTFLNVSM